MEYGLFSAYREIIQFISMMLSITVLSYRYQYINNIKLINHAGSIIILKILTKSMNLQSKTVGIIGSISQFLSTSVLILSTESWMIFSGDFRFIFKFTFKIYINHRFQLRFSEW